MLTHSLADKLKSITPAKAHSAQPVNTDALRAKLTSLAAKIAEVEGEAVQTVTEPTQISECLSCSDPVGAGHRFCSECDAYIKSRVITMRLPDDT